MKMVTITGLPLVLKKLHAVTTAQEAVIGTNLKKAGLYLQRQSQKVTPVLSGDLKGSANTRNIGGKGFQTDIVVSYGSTVNYAIYVHEMIDNKHKKGKIAKYLEHTARIEKSNIFKIVAGKTLQ